MANAKGRPTAPHRDFLVEIVTAGFPPGEGLHSTAISGNRNLERVVEQPARIPAIRASSVWSEEEEDHITLEKFNIFRSRGKLQGYSIFVASFLPLKSERQVRDRIRALKRNGLLPPDGEQPGTPTIQAAEGVPVAAVDVQHPRLDPQVEDDIPISPIQEEQAMGTGAPPATTVDDPAEPSGEVGEAVDTDVGRSAQLMSSFGGGAPVPGAAWIIYLQSLEIGDLPFAQRLLALAESDGEVSRQNL